MPPDETRSLLARARAVLAEDGPAGVFFRTLRRLGIYRTFIVIGGVNEPGPEAGPEVDVVAAPLGPDEIDEYRALRPDQSREEIEGRFRGGHLCFAARHEGRVVAAAWTALGHAELDFVPCRVRLAEGVSFTYDVYVSAEMRGRRLSNALSEVRGAHLLALGHPRKVGVIEPENRAARHRNQRRRNPDLAVLSCLRIGPWRRVRIRSLEPGAEPGIELA